MRFMKWLHPGLHIKRWLFLFGLGMMCSSFGIILTFNYQWLGSLEEWAFRLLYEVTGHYNYTILASLGILVILLGLVVMAWATRRLIRTMIGVVMPGESENLSDLIFSNLQLSKGPKVVVIGGGVSKAGEMLVEGAKKGFLKYVFYPSTGVRFNLAVLGNDAGIIGAALLGKQED